MLGLRCYRVSDHGEVVELVDRVEWFVQQVGDRVDAELFEGKTCFNGSVENVFHDVLEAIQFHLTCDGHRVGRCRSMDRVTGTDS